MELKDSAGHTFLAFGDETEDEDLLVYAFVIVRDDRADEARAVLASAKRSLNVSENVTLHCRIIFSGQRRRGTSWQDVNPAHLQAVLRELVQNLGRIVERPEIRVLERCRIPALPAAPGHPDREWRTKETLGLAANAAMVGAVTRFGKGRVRFVIDGDRTQVQRGVRYQRADSTRGFFIDIGSGEPPRIDPEVQEGESKDKLLELADLYGYITRRALSRAPGQWFSEVFGIAQPYIRRMEFSPDPSWTDVPNRPVTS